MQIGTRRLKALNNPCLYVDPDMDLHSKVSVATLLSLEHLRISSAGGILGRTWRLNDCGFDNRAPGEPQPLNYKVLVDQDKDSISYSMHLKQVSEVQNHRLIGNQPTA